jgi:hypothetical protein
LAEGFPLDQHARKTATPAFLALFFCASKSLLWPSLEHPLAANMYQFDESIYIFPLLMFALVFVFMLGKYSLGKYWHALCRQAQRDKLKCAQHIIRAYPSQAQQSLDKTTQKATLQLEQAQTVVTPSASLRHVASILFD